MKRFCEQLCPNFQVAMDVIGKPWNAMILVALEAGPARFGEITDKLGAIGDRMLSERLKELAHGGLIERRVIEGPPVRVAYELTAAGRGFSKVYEAIARWGETLPLGDSIGACPLSAAEGTGERKSTAVERKRAVSASSDSAAHPSAPRARAKTTARARR